AVAPPPEAPAAIVVAVVAPAGAAPGGFTRGVKGFFVLNTSKLSEGGGAVCLATVVDVGPGRTRGGCDAVPPPPPPNSFGKIKKKNRSRSTTPAAAITATRCWLAESPKRSPPG